MRLQPVDAMQRLGTGVRGNDRMSVRTILLVIAFLFIVVSLIGYAFERGGEQKD